MQDALRNKKLQELVLETFIPAESVTIKRGKSQTTKSISYFPGYILIRMVLTDELWYLLKDVSKISGFIGKNQSTPRPIPDAEIKAIRDLIDQGTKQSQLDSVFQVGETVLIIDGPFMDFKGVIEHIDVEKSKLTLIVSIFGRTTPLDLELDKVKPLPKEE